MDGSHGSCVPESRVPAPAPWHVDHRCGRWRWRRRHSRRAK